VIKLLLFWREIRICMCSLY